MQVKLYAINNFAGMLLPSQNSTSTKGSRSTSEQELILQIQSELLELIRVTPDERIVNSQETIRLGDWSSTLESEISSFLW